VLQSSAPGPFRLRSVRVGQAKGKGLGEPLGEGRTVVRGTVADWPNEWHTVYVTFHANWLLRRTKRSCYLILPALTGSVVPFGMARREATLLASTNVRVIDGYVDTAQSQPPPGSAIEGQDYFTWRCDQRAVDARRLVTEKFEGKLALGFPESAYKRQALQQSGCEAVAVIDESAGTSERGFRLLLFGALIALGLTLIVEATLKGSDWRTRHA
jgi:hypothetical protein